LLGFKDVRAVRSSKLFVIDLGSAQAAAARKQVEEMCRRLLANPVIHDYSISIEK
jgi:phosphoribosylformylglycinamidine synthase subunit PurS